LQSSVCRAERHMVAFGKEVLFRESRPGPIADCRMTRLQQFLIVAVAIF
jgi:hypothetical protein